MPPLLRHQSPVHKARTIDGRAVAVKILRPDIRRIFEKDIALFHKLATMAETYIPLLRRLRLWMGGDFCQMGAYRNGFTP